MNDQWLNHRANVLAKTVMERWSSDWDKNLHMLENLIANAIAEGANAQFCILNRIKAEKSEAEKIIPLHRNKEGRLFTKRPDSP